VVRDYTLRRLVYMVDWARSNFPVDSTRIWTLGYSAAAIGSALLAFERSGLISAVMNGIGKYDLSFITEPDPDAQFNPGNMLRIIADGLWGPVALNLPTNGGLPVFDRLNLGFMAGWIEPAGVPPLMSFDGRHDAVLGWAEKVGFYRAMQRHRQGGTFFWDNRSHTGDAIGAWAPMGSLSWPGQFRSNRSYPALSNCSADDDPGDGTEASGDTVGTINGFVVWDTTLVDQPEIWKVTLRLQELRTLWDTIPAPESLTVDVTPRRLQRFHPAIGTPCAWRAIRLADQAEVQSGVAWTDSIGRVTVEGVRVFRDGTRLEIDQEDLLDVDTGAGPARWAMRIAPHPVRGRAEIALAWPAGSGDARVDLYDVAGREVRRLWRGPAAHAPASLALDASGIPGGLYFVVARSPSGRLARRAVVLP
jgi:hypothetical protein